MNKYCDEVKVGSVFKRIDKNENHWKAVVVNRTDMFVDIQKSNPYKPDFSEIERYQINRIYKEVGIGEYRGNLFNPKVLQEITEHIPTDEYYINCKEMTGPIYNRVGRDRTYNFCKGA